MDLEKGGEGDEKVTEMNGGGYLGWEDLTVVIPNFGNGPTKRLLNGVSGYAEAGRIIAIMGPSGSGKSTLLDSLAGRLSRNLVMTGNILLNGRKRRLNYGDVAYVTQQDALMGTLTIRETLTYSAQLRLPTNNLKKLEVYEVVDSVITQMGLQDCADNLVGNWHLRGISGGEKKRLSIALEILTQPHLLFLDEPTTGLDSASAFFVVQVLKNLAVACGGGRTVVCSVHQPSSEVFAQFDDLCLLSSSGETIYFGEAKMAVEFFADCGFPCPTRRNPSDHFLRCINSDFDQVNATLIGSQRFTDIIKESSGSTIYLHLPTSEIKAKLLQNFRYSKYASRVRTRFRETSTMQEEVVFIEKERGSKAIRCRKQLTTLIRRSSTNMSRDFGYYWLRIIMYIVLALCVGTVFHNVGTNYSAVMARGACGGITRRLEIFYKERQNGHYGVGLFILSNFISSFPFLVMMSFSSVAIIYCLVRFHPGFFHFTYATLDLLCSIAVVESCMMVVASILPNFTMALITGAGLIGIMMISAGFFRPFPDLPKFFWRYPISYVNFMAWALQGAYKNDMLGLKFDPMNTSEAKLDGEVILTTTLGILLEHLKWWDLGAIIAILIAYRVAFFAILKLRETALPYLYDRYTKRTLQRISKRPSFRKIPPPFPSKRHHIMHSLSSQEGLNSPIH